MSNALSKGNQQRLSGALRQRHITMISLGGIIGAGLFVGSSATIQAIGPAAFLSYLAAGIVVMLVMRMLGEMAVALPGVGSFTEYARIGLGNWVGFTSGWLYWYFWVIVVAVEAVVGANILEQWIPLPAWMIGLSLLAIMTAINCLSVKSYGEFEYWFASLKVFAIIVFIGVVAAYLFGFAPSTTDLLGNLVSKVDHLVIGGGMANTFLVAQGVEVGNSLAERDMADTAREILAKAKAAGCTIHLPVDVVVAREFKAGAAHETVAAGACPADAMILDAGPQTVAALTKVFETCKTLIWNGPLGAFEIEPFNMATNAAARVAADLTRAGKLVSVAGGGDTVAALNHAGVAGDFTFISTAGGAFLEWMEGKELPGVAALSI